MFEFSLCMCKVIWAERYFVQRITQLTSNSCVQIYTWKKCCFFNPVVKLVYDVKVFLHQKFISLTVCEMKCLLFNQLNGDMRRNKDTVFGGGTELWWVSWHDECAVHVKEYDIHVGHARSKTTEWGKFPEINVFFDFFVSYIDTNFHHIQMYQ